MVSSLSWCPARHTQQNMPAMVTRIIASFPGLHHRQVLIAKTKGEDQENFAHAPQKMGKQLGGGWCLMKDLEALLVISCPRTLRLECLKGSVNACCSVDINVTISDQAPPLCLPSVHSTSSHVTKSPRPFPSIFAYCKRLKNWRWK